MFRFETRGLNLKICLFIYKLDTELSIFCVLNLSRNQYFSRIDIVRIDHEIINDLLKVTIFSYFRINSFA